MAGVKGKSGRKANEQVFRHAILEKLDALDPSKDRKRVLNIAETLIKAAESGEPWAVKEVMDRVDGRPKQQTELSGPNGGAIPLRDATDLTDDELAAIAAASGD